jgi:hypothetical protein
MEKYGIFNRGVLPRKCFAAESHQRNSFLMLIVRKDDERRCDN